MLTIRRSTGTRFPLSLSEDSGSSQPAWSSITVGTVKERIEREHSEYPILRQRLIYKGRILEDSKTLESYDIMPESTVFLVVSGGAGANGSNASSSAIKSNSSTSGSTTSASHTSAATSNSSGQNMSDLFSGLMEQQHIMGGSSSQAANSNSGTDLMTRLFQSQMDSNPALQRLMEQNPQLRELMQDPQALQQAVQMMQNPEAMQQAMRQQDLALSQLENMPGGFAALSNLYRDVQAPLEDSMYQGQDDQDSSSNRRPSDRGDAGATGTAMPNPWGSNTSPTSRAPPMMGPGAAGFNPWASLGGQGAASSPGTTAAPGATNPWATMGMPPNSSAQQPQLNVARAILDNPSMSQMMQQTVRDHPDMIRQALEQRDPFFRQMFANNPQAGNAFVQQMMQPEVLRSAMNMQEQMMGTGGGTAGQPGQMDFSQLFGAPASGGSQPPPLFPPFGMPPSSGGTGGGLDFASLLANAQQQQQPSAPPANPADQYRRQLQSLYSMGFDDEQRNLDALQVVHGNLNRAVDWLLDPANSAPSNTSSASSSHPTHATEALASAPAPPESSTNSNPDNDMTEGSSSTHAPKDVTEKKND